MTESLDNVEIEVTITVIQRAGYPEPILGQAKRTSQGTVALDSIAGDIKALADECVEAARKQVRTTREIKALQSRLLIEQDNSPSD